MALWDSSWDLYLPDCPNDTGGKPQIDGTSPQFLPAFVPPGEKEPVHSHRWPSVLYIQTAGDFVDHDGEGNVILDTRQLKTPLQFPLTMWKDPEAPHSVENLSKTITLHLIRVEMKSKGSTGRSTTRGPHHEMTPNN